MILTKELQVQELPIGRKIRVSSNVIREFGFTPATRLGVVSSGKAVVLSPQADGLIKVHERGYAGLRPPETVIELSSQPLINGLLPAGWNRVHFTFETSRITIRPVAPQLFHIRKEFRRVRHLDAFMTLSSGLDASAFAAAGFRISAVLEWRPPEARDDNDLSETGMRTFLANHQPLLAFNEDLTTINPRTTAALVRQKIGIVACLSCGLQCDDWSLAKSATLKRAEMAEFAPSSRELGYYATKLLEEVRPASCLIEQVPGWLNSESAAVMGAVLRRMGYHVQARVLDAADYGALTTRRRCYFVASIFPGFEFPLPSTMNATPLGTLLADEIPLMRDVSHTKTIAKAKQSNRARFTPLTSTVAPTVLKSQNRQTKDSLYFQTESGSLLFPTINALRTIQGVPTSFDFSHVNSQIASEQIGQGIDFPLHASVARSLLCHLRTNQVGQGQLAF